MGRHDTGIVNLVPAKLGAVAVAAAGFFACEGRGTMGLRSGDGPFVAADADVRDGRSTDTPDVRPAPVTPSLAFLSPLAGETVVRDSVFRHEWTAPLDVTLEAQGLTHVSLLLDGEDVGTVVGPSWALQLLVINDGPHELRATGYDDAGIEQLVATTTINVTGPADDSCHSMLDALGLDWSLSGDQRGVSDPVYVQPTINGVSFRYTSSATASRMMMDCELAPRLYEVAELAKAFGFDEVEHIGIYNYRCIGGGDPDTGCTPSKHASARAIDFHSFNNTSSGERASVEDDWIITAGEVCDGSTVTGPDTTLHEIACAMWRTATFNIILTPDYNSDHRDHFHVDLTSGHNSISLSARGIDPLLPGLGH